MPNFEYKARDKDGMLISGMIDADSAMELKEALFQEGMIPLDVHEVGKGSWTAASLKQYFNKVKPEDLMVFTRQFYTLFKAGASMDIILLTLAKQTKSKSLANALARVRVDVSSGSTLTQAFSKHPNVFNELYVSMLSAGEEAGILEDVLDHLSDLLERDFEIQKGVKGAMMYPKIVFVVLFLAIIFLMTFVVPRFVDFYGSSGAQLPLPTKILIGISNFVVGYWFVVLAGIGVALFSFHQYYRTAQGRLAMDQYKMEFPVFGPLNVKVANARFGHIMAALYKSGLPMPRSLDVVSNVIGNTSFAVEVQQVKEEIQKGSTLSEALSRRKYFSPVMIETTAVGEKAGALGEMLSTIAQHYDMEVSHTIRNLTTILEPILLVVIFSIVALLALAIFLPIWNMSAVIHS